MDPLAKTEMFLPGSAAIPSIMTDRLLLRPHRLDDFDSYAAFWNSEDIMRFIGGIPVTREQAWIRMMRTIGMWHSLGFGFWIIEERTSGRLVGEAGFLDLHRDMTPSTEGTLETGWAIDPAFHGRGYATEAISAAIGWASAHFPGKPITCIINESNAASLRVAEKIGFRDTGRAIYNGHEVMMFTLQAAPERPERRV